MLVIVALAASTVVAALVFVARRRRRFSTDAQTSTFHVLHTANLAAPALRRGFTSGALDRAGPHLLALVGTPALAVTSTSEVLTFVGDHRHHCDSSMGIAATTLASGRSHIEDVPCAHELCPVRVAVSVPLEVDGIVVGTLVAFAADGGPGLIRAMTEVAAWIRSQIELAELDQNRAQLAKAELSALRAQISPHFIYNALTAIASFTRSDPNRARTLLLEFADFTRYSLSSHGEFTTVADELRSVEHYLTLEQARFGERLAVDLRVAPEVLLVAIPFLVVQPLVENAVRHGIEPRARHGRVSIVASEQSNDCVITIEDDGVGADPDLLRACLNGDPEAKEHIGLFNVDERMRSIYGPSYGLVIETAEGAGTKVTVRAPKYRPGVRAS
jgi:two-component system, LytTR family, sensor kinase